MKKTFFMSLFFLILLTLAHAEILPGEKGEPLNILEVYDSGKDAWTIKPPMSTARFALGAAFSRGRLFLIGGEGKEPDSFSDAVESFDPQTLTWRKESPLPIPRSGLVAVAGMDEKIYVLGGRNKDGVSGNLDVYDPVNNSWSIKKPMPTPRANPAATIGADGKIYVFGGSDPRKGLALSNLEVYDPIVDRWLVKSPLPTPRQSASTSVGLDGKLYIFGGYDPQKNKGLSVIDVYDPLDNIYWSKESMPQPGYSFGVVTGIDGTMFLIGGNSSPGQTVSEMVGYDFLTGKWEKRAAPHYRRHSLAVAVGKDGLIYAAGGYGLKNQ